MSCHPNKGPQSLCASDSKDSLAIPMNGEVLLLVDYGAVDNQDRTLLFFPNQSLSLATKRNCEPIT